MRRSITLSLASLGVAFLTGCGAATPASTSPAATAPAQQGTTIGAPIQVATTMSVLADMVKNVGGERVQVTNIIPVGAGPEDYQPSPADARTLAQADVLIANGFGLEEWLDDLFESAGKPELRRFDAAEGLTPLESDHAEEGHSEEASGTAVAEEGHSEEAGHEHAKGNPHFWLSAANGIVYVENIRDALSDVDPAGAQTYAANAERYIAELRQLNDELKQQAATVPEASRKLVTNHDAFPYFAQEYGFTVVGNVVANPEAEPSAGDLAALLQTIKEQQVTAIFAESQFNPKLVDVLAQDAGVAVIPDLYTDTLGEPGSPAASYIEMLRYDMTTIVSALTR